ncbi:MAG TPA: dTMP kinase [Acidimicrobiia bacterium]|jgi:dTMP kinase|nr:dTMP kinase [Acidimicrobiia bacterium]
MATSGVFVVLEGGDGCGKSTQAQLLVSRLRDLGREVVATREPGATEAGAAIRSLVLGGGDLDARAEALLIAADRAEHVAEVIRPALERGAVVVSDRYIPSSLAYQGVARGLGVDEIARLSEWATGGLTPDLVVVVDVPVFDAERRRAGPRDRMEREPAEFRALVNQAYRDHASRFGWAVVDGTAPVEEVAEQIWELVRPLV